MLSATGLLSTLRVKFLESDIVYINLFYTNISAMLNRMMADKKRFGKVSFEIIGQERLYR